MNNNSFNVLHGEQAPVKFDPPCDPQRFHENASLLDELIQELCASWFSHMPDFRHLPG
jgi:hypothetical protein